MRPLAVVTCLLLAGVAPACSDSVPPPGATLSGAVWIDGNANGLRDKCDPPGASASPHLELRSVGRQVQEVKAGEDGTFTFTEVPRGTYELVVRQEGGFQWPVTAPRDGDGRMGYALDLRGYEKLEGLDFGIAGQEPLKIYPDGYGLFVVVFDDSDIDGQLDTGECALPASQGTAAFSDGEEPPSFVGQLAIYKYEDLRTPPGGFKPDYRSWGLNPFMVATRLDALGCPEEVMPASVPGSRLFQASVGMRVVQETASVTPQVFLDVNANGVQDNGEPDYYLPVTMTSLCEGGPSFASSRSRNAVDGFTAVPPGRWRIGLEVTQWLGRFDFDVVPTTPRSVEIDVDEDDKVDVEFGVAYPSAAFIRVVAVRDDNLNGQAEPEEPPLAGAVVCADGRDIGSQGCGPTSNEGAALLGPLAPGSYQVWVAGITGEGRSEQAPAYSPATVAANEVASLTIPVPP